MHALPLTTASLRLRHFTVEDAPRILTLNGEPSTRSWLPSHAYADEGEAREALRYLIACYAQPGDPRQAPYVLAVEDPRAGLLLGHVGFSPLDGEVEVSYAVAEAFRRRGHGTEALVHACGWVRGVFGLERVIAATAAENIASRRLLERAGFAHLCEEAARLHQGRQRPISMYQWGSGPRAIRPDASSAGG